MGQQTSNQQIPVSTPTQTAVNTSAEPVPASVVNPAIFAPAADSATLPAEHYVTIRKPYFDDLRWAKTYYPIIIIVLILVIAAGFVYYMWFSGCRNMPKVVVAGPLT